MSSRALRRLREVQQQQLNLDSKQDEDSCDDDEEEDICKKEKSPLFHSRLFLTDSDSESNGSGSSDESDEAVIIPGENEVSSTQVIEPHPFENNNIGKRRGGQQQQPPPKLNVDYDWDDDLQHLINTNTVVEESSQLHPTHTNLSTLLIQSMNASHLDVDHVLRQVLGQARPRNGSTSKKRFFFGEPKAHWMNNKPPTYVGGGIGMVPIATGQDDQPRFVFQYSETYTTTQRTPFQSQVQPSADVNILAMFIANNPYCVEALYQLALFFYRIGEMENGNELLRRALFVHECAFHSTFRDEIFRSTTKQQQQQPRIMDATCPENAPFFLELFTLMQVASMMGCFPTSLAISQFLLALDPHRDCMGMLCCFLDFFSLAANREDFIVELVESNLVKITPYRVGTKVEEEKQACCDLLDMPNWAFSYALAKKRLENRMTGRCRENDDTATLQNTADQCLQSALYRFPSVLCALIENNQDCQRRANNMDWSAVATSFQQRSSHCNANPHDIQAIAHIAKIYIQRSRSLWYEQTVWAWLYQCARHVIESNGETIPIDTRLRTQNGSIEESPPPSYSVLERYLACDPEDYQDAFKRLPMDANPLEGARIRPALEINNVPRNNRRLPRPINNDEIQANGQERDLPHILFGRRGAEYTIINADDPILSIFLRSILPWTRVDGVP